MLIRIVKSIKKLVCPPATQDLALNTKNRDATIKKYNYGPLNVDEPAGYWEKIAKYWKTSVKAAKKSVCYNCVAFDISPRIKKCLPGDTLMPMECSDIAGCTTLNAILLALVILGQKVVQSKQIKNQLNGKRKTPEV